MSDPSSVPESAGSTNRVRIPLRITSDGKLVVLSPESYGSIEQAKLAILKQNGTVEREQDRLMDKICKDMGVTLGKPHPKKRNS